MPHPFYLKIPTDELMDSLQATQELKENYGYEFDIDNLKIEMGTMKKMKAKLEKMGGYDLDLQFVSIPTIKQTQQLNFQNTYDMLVNDTRHLMNTYKDYKQGKEELDKFGIRENIIVSELHNRYKKKIKRLKPKIEQFQDAKDYYKSFDGEKTKKENEESMVVYKELKVMKDKKKKFKEIIKNLEEMKK